jgi:hypothetical protein
LKESLVLGHAATYERVRYAGRVNQDNSGRADSATPRDEDAERRARASAIGVTPFVVDRRDGGNAVESPNLRKGDTTNDTNPLLNTI